MLWIVFGDWLFWILFLICLAFGLWSFVAGTFAAIISVAIYLAWNRTRLKYRCETCKANWDYVQVTREDLYRDA